MSEAENLPTTNDGNPTPCSNTGCCGHSMLARAVLYVPVVLALTGLGAMAMFPGLADYALGPTPRTCSNSKSSCSSANANCPIQMLMRAFSSEPKQEMKPATSSSAAPTEVSMQMFDCCPYSRCNSKVNTESSTAGETVIESAANSDEPADALAAVMASQAKPESQDPPAVSN